MTDDELRGLIRAAIHKHMGSASDVPAGAGTIRLPDATLPVPQSGSPAISISFGQYRLERAAGDTSCLIEPAVQCNHCGFCKCHGH
jgi:hypothetical protein